MFSKKENFKEEYIRNLAENFSKPLDQCSKLERYEALVDMVMKESAIIRTETSKRQREQRQKKVYYFSMEFLIGRLLDNDPELSSQHYGIRNVNDRLKQYYGPESGLRYHIDDGMTVVTMALPLSKVREQYGER